VFQPNGGYLVPERCIEQHVRLAAVHGARIVSGEAVEAWDRLDGGGVRVTTRDGEYRAAQLVVTSGSWTGTLVPSLTHVLRPERQVLAWFDPLQPELFLPGRFPVFNVAVDEGHFYGFPSVDGQGFKVGKYHHFGETVDPDTVDRSVHARDEALLRTFTSRYFPAAAGRTLDTKVCLFTNAPDEHFIIDRLADDPGVVVASACSGHGFKFASVVGEILADLVEHGETPHDISMFRIDRFPQS
jgi:sarcosine oxidase